MRVGARARSRTSTALRRLRELARYKAKFGELENSDDIDDE